MFLRGNSTVTGSTFIPKSGSSLMRHPHTFPVHQRLWVENAPRSVQSRDILFLTKWCHNNRDILHIWPPYIPGPVCSSVPRCEQLVQWLDIWATNREWRGFRSLLPKGDKSRAISSASKWGERDSTEGGRRISAPEPWRLPVHRGILYSHKTARPGRIV